jgi:hypothetical protein
MNCAVKKDKLQRIYLLEPVSWQAFFRTSKQTVLKINNYGLELQQ